jgi:sulfite oxidase
MCNPYNDTTEGDGMPPQNAVASQIIHTRDPLNSGPLPEILVQSFITPVSQFFIRNHGAIPFVNRAAFRLLVDGLVQRPVLLSLDDLRRYRRISVTSTIQCAGNRRRELAEAVAPIEGEIMWGPEAIGTATWDGFALADVLADAQPLASASCVEFVGLDQISHGDTPSGFGGSIEISKAYSPETILADQMNGVPLSHEHGAPLRAVVPGYIGARSVKWLARISLLAEPSVNYFQRRAYRLFPRDIAAASANWDAAPMIGPTRVTSAICQIRLVANDTRIAIKGYAMGTDRAQIERVDVSLDEGATWNQVHLLPPKGRWSWRLWEIELPATPDASSIIARAQDKEGSVQPTHLEDIWNFKGYLNWACHRIELKFR